MRTISLIAVASLLTVPLLSAPVAAEPSTCIFVQPQALCFAFVANGGGVSVVAAEPGEEVLIGVGSVTLRFSPSLSAPSIGAGRESPCETYNPVDAITCESNGFPIPFTTADDLEILDVYCLVRGTIIWDLNGDGQEDLRHPSVQLSPGSC